MIKEYAYFAYMSMRGTVNQIIGFFCKQPKNFLAYKDIHKGDRCFIIATGPSLSLDDLNLLQDEYTFGVNSIIKSFDKTDWRPTYYVISDPIPFEKCKDAINEKDFKEIFFPKNFKEKKIRHVAYNKNRSQACYAEARHEYLNMIFPSNNPEKYLVDSASVVFAAIQIATFMGFKNIYLLGQDCNFSTPNSHSDIASVTYDIPTNQSAESILMSCFENYKKFYSKRGVNICNCTRGGKLEVFRRVDLESVLYSE